MDIKEISQKLNEQARTIAAMLLPGGREHNREWSAGSIAGEQGNSLKVCISGAKVGVWSDFATGDSGDLLDLWRMTKGISLADAISEAKTYLGIVDPPLEKLGKKTFHRPQRAQSVKKIAPKSKIAVYLAETRKLADDALKAYRISEAAEIGPYPGWKTQAAWQGPWVVMPSLRNNELIACKYLHLERKDGKKQTFVEANCEPCLFGWQAIGENQRDVIICEGELDAITCYQYGHPALSVPFGGGNGAKQQWLDYEMGNLDRFDTIYLAMDNDGAGMEAIDEIIGRLGKHRCKVITLPHKDANKCLQEGMTKEEFDDCVKSAKFRKPDELITFKDISQSIIEEFYPKGGSIPGFNTPWENVPFKFRRSELSLWTGVNGHGKSALLNYLMLCAAFQGEKVCIASLEMPVKKTAYRLIRQTTGNVKPSIGEIEKCLEWFDMKFWAFNLVGTAKVEKLIETFRFAYKRYGVRQFVIDSLLKCGISEDDYNGQKRFMEVLCDFVNSTDSHVHLVAHSRKHENEDYIVGKLDIKGTGAISDLAWNTFTVWRNKKKEHALSEFKDTGEISMTTGTGKGKTRPLTIEELKALPDAMLVCDKARNEEWEGKARLYYNWQSIQYHDQPGTPSVDFLQVTNDAIDEDSGPF